MCTDQDVCATTRPRSRLPQRSTRPCRYRTVRAGSTCVPSGHYTRGRERPYLQFLQAIKRAGAIRTTTGWPGRLHAGCALDTRAARRTP